MTKEISTAIALLGDNLDWTSMSRNRGVWQVEESGRAEIAPLEGGGAAAEEEPRPTAVADLAAPFALCLPGSEILFRALELPTTDPAEVADMVALQLDKHLPLSPDEMTISCELLGNDEINTRVMACAVPNSTIAAKVERLGEQPARVGRVDAAPLAAMRMLYERDVVFANGRELLLLDEGRDMTLLVLDAGLPVLIRPVGAASSPAANLLRAVRLSLVQAELEQGPGTLEQISIVSSRPEAESLSRAAAETFGCSVRQLQFGESDSFSLGTVLRSHEPGTLNLTPAEWRSSVASRQFRKRLLQIAGGGFAIWALLAAALYGGPAVLDHRATRVEEAIRVLEPSARAVRDVQNRVRMIQTYMDRELSSLEVLLEISKLLPEGIELGSLRYRRDENRVSVQGSAESTALVYEYKQRVDNSALFSESTLVSGPTINQRTRVADFELLVRFKEDTP